MTTRRSGSRRTGIPEAGGAAGTKAEVDEGIAYLETIARQLVALAELKRRVPA
jgi:hypothetical protein